MTADSAMMLEQERRFWQAMQDKDTAAAAAMTDTSCIVAGAQGAASIDPKMMAGMLAGGTWELESFTIDPVKLQVRLLTPDVALVAYPVSERLKVEGKPLELTAYDTSVWIRRGDDWKCAMHTESLAGDPFGRDRKGA